MSTWGFTLRERFTHRSQRSFRDDLSFSGFQRIREVVTLDSILCADLVDELSAEDWQHNVHDDHRTGLFRDANYLLARQTLDASYQQLIAAVECPSVEVSLPGGFSICGHDIMDASLDNSTLTNCGPIPEAFKAAEVNQVGLIDDRERAFAIRDAMRELQPEAPHMGACEVWLIARWSPQER